MCVFVADKCKDKTIFFVSFAAYFNKLTRLKSVTNVTTQQQQNHFIYLFDTTKTNIKCLFVVTLSYKVNKQNTKCFLFVGRLNKQTT